METQIASLGKDEWNEQLANALTVSYNLFFAKAKRIIGVSEDAEDVVMDVFVSLLDDPQPVRNIIAYILQAVRNKALDFLKKKKPMLVEDIYRFKHRMVSNPQSFEDRQRLDYYLSKANLSKEQKVLWLYIELEYENAEIAQLLGATPDQIRKDRFVLIRKIQKIAIRLDQGL